MIVADGRRAAALAGPRGDLLGIADVDGALRVVAELGWDRGTQVTPQRRLLLGRDAVFVLEPCAGPLLEPPLRVRRFGLDGREADRVEDDGAPGTADLYFRARRAGDRVRVARFGVDAATGGPTRWEGVVATDLVRITDDVSGTPCRAAGAWWYAVRQEGVIRAPDDGSAEDLPGRCGHSAERVRDAAVAVGARKGGAGAWIDGVWRPFGPGGAFPPFRTPLLGAVAPHGDTGLAAVRRDGGALAVLDGPPATLPPGIYTGIVRLGDRLFALHDGKTPRLVPASF